MARDERDDEKQRRKPRTLAGRLIAGIGLVIGLLALSLVVSILLEWGGMTFGWWEEQGPDHSRNMLIEEVAYLQEDFRRELFGGSPAQWAIGTVTWVYGWLFIRSGLVNLHDRLAAPATAAEPSLMVFFKRLYRKFGDYLAAMSNIIQLFTVRLMVIALSLPMFALIGIAALVDGLVQRDLRRLGGGIERGRLYHIAKDYLKPMLILPAFVYLAVPAPIHPNLIFMPAAALFGLAIFIAATTFKKYF